MEEKDLSCKKLEGDGMAFCARWRYNYQKKFLQAGEVLKVDTGCLVGFTQGVNYDIEFVGGIKNTLFGGEGLFFCNLTRGREVYMYSLCRLVDWQIELLPQRQELEEVQKEKEVF